MLTNPRQEAFCQFWVFGDPKLDPTDPQSTDSRNNASQSYMAAGYRARGAAARACASRLLTNANIQARIAELRQEEQRVREVYMRSWRTLLPKAQQVLEDALDGKEISGRQIQAARIVIEQAEGPAHLRFGDQRGSDAQTPLNITLWSGAPRPEGHDDRWVHHRA